MLSRLLGTGPSRPRLGSRTDSFGITNSRKLYKKTSVYIGEGTATQIVEIPISAMKACPCLQETLEDGSRIPYVDLKIFQVVIDYLNTNTILKARGADITIFDPLFDGEDALLDFAKAWVLGHELELPEFQNRLVDAYNNWYAKSLVARTPISPSAAAFSWLRDHIANHTPAGKFLVEFSAGMCRFDVGSNVDEKLNKDIAGYIQNRWTHVLAKQGNKADRILNNGREFRIWTSDKHVQARTLKIVPPLCTPPMGPVSPATLAESWQSTKGRPGSSASLRSVGSVRTVRLCRTKNSSFLSFPPPEELDGESELREESSDNDSGESIDFLRSPDNLRKEPPPLK
ncbi:hypothetical protein BU23DRAFT_569362 [Bimuria novae-zelandiae CBS 107.79]|uniref:Uncharacterized protein n=1 Tax=Bimuria novae-zelandiae CBS 107.79 TaxID=1447943 RepID=A0A6A5V3Y5_9PLEO|nr:hypothetical protein BU23DRAFT_569362 [Bimuria novae-zelandiae CBS 107.79]